MRVRKNPPSEGEGGAPQNAETKALSAGDASYAFEFVSRHAILTLDIAAMIADCRVIEVAR